MTPEHRNPFDRAQWIWFPGARREANCTVLARQRCILTATPKQAELRVSAWTDYVAFVNGTRVGQGPAPSHPEYQEYDSWEVSSLLAPGVNTIAVLAKNDGVATHRLPFYPGGLIAQFDVDGQTVVATDVTWDIRRADAWRRESPRAWWPAGFLEVFDGRLWDEAWLAGGGTTSGWTTPEVIGPPGVWPWLRLLPGEVKLREHLLVPVAGQRLVIVAPAVHQVSFAPLLPVGSVGVALASWVVTSPSEREAILLLECDDAHRVWLNGVEVRRLERKEQFLATREWSGCTVIDQVHYAESGAFSRPETTVKLCAGENRLVVAVDAGPGCWGFLLGLLNSETRRPLSLDGAARWELFGPFPTTGFADALDNFGPDHAVGAGVVTCDPRDPWGVTDCARLMELETRRSEDVIAEPAGWIALAVGQGAILDFGQVDCGHLVLELEAAAEAILDFGLTRASRLDHGMVFSNGGLMKAVDRIYVRPGVTRWRGIERRTGRWLHLVCRAGGPVRVRTKLTAVSAAGEPAAEFRCDDPVIEAIHTASLRTTALVMQHGYQDCLRRERDTLNTSSFNYASRAGLCAFAAQGPARRSLRRAVRYSSPDGWFHSHGISALNEDETTQILYWVIWLRDWWRCTGDRELLAELLPAAEGGMRFYARRQNRHGLLDGRLAAIVRRGSITYVDDTTANHEHWRHFDGELIGDNLLFAAACGALAELLEASGRTDEAAMARQRGARTSAALKNRLYDAAAGRFAAWRKGDEMGGDEHPIFAIAMLYFHLLPPEDDAALFARLLERTGLPGPEKKGYPLHTFGFYFYYIQVLFDRGRDDLALELMRRVHGAWLARGETAFGEYVGGGDLYGAGLFTDDHEIHAYGCSAHWHFYANILGVTPTEPGYAMVHLAPKPGNLQHAEGRFHTVRGPVAVRWRIEGGVFFCAADLPAGMRWTWTPPPRHAGWELTINGRRTIETKGRTLAHDEIKML